VIKTHRQGNNLIVRQVQSCASRYSSLGEKNRTLMGELRDKKEASGRTNSLTGTSLSSKRLRSISFPSSLSLTETCCFFLFDGCMMLMDQQQDNKKLEKNADSFPLFALVF